MPTSSEHAARIGDGLRFVCVEYAEKHPNELVIAYFYTALHMFESALYDFTAKPKPQHFYAHGDRTLYLSRVRFDRTHWFYGRPQDYEALRRISEQARYLSPAGSHTHEPLHLPRDVHQALALFTDIRRQIEREYQTRGKPLPRPALPSS